tara:strand:- start:13687 stop:13953 length:267 start_codon:yes stop_codon:yes gene_type:complete
MRLLFTKSVAKDFEYWKRKDPRLHRRIVTLIDAIEADPFSGVGKPEPLKGDLSGWWSRRISGEHRLVYRVTGPKRGRALEVLSCRYRY